MDHSYSPPDDEERSHLDLSDEDALSLILANPVPTPPASEWSDTSIHDGAGSEEGDTYKYECTECRLVCANVEELCSHLKTSSAHVVCPICLREFYGKDRDEKAKAKQDHLYQHRKQQRQFEHGYYSAEVPGGGNTSLDSLPTMSGQGEKQHDPFSGEMNQPEIHGADLQIEQPRRLDKGKGKERCPNTDQGTSIPVVSQEGSSDGYEAADGFSKPGATTHKGGSNTKNLQDISDGILPYYHWELDSFVEKLRNLDLEKVRDERHLEMTWMREFEGA